MIASVSCIYGIGSPKEYESQKNVLFTGDLVNRQEFLRNLVAIQYERNDIDFVRGCFRVRGDIVEVFPAHEDSNVIRIEFFDNEIDGISVVDPLRGAILQKLNKVTIYPKSHYVVGEDKLKAPLKQLRLSYEGACSPSKNKKNSLNFNA